MERTTKDMALELIAALADNEADTPEWYESFERDNREYFRTDWLQEKVQETFKAFSQFGEDAEYSDPDIHSGDLLEWVGDSHHHRAAVDQLLKDAKNDGYVSLDELITAAQRRFIESIYDACADALDGALDSV